MQTTRRMLLDDEAVPARGCGSVWSRFRRLREVAFPVVARELLLLEAFGNVQAELVHRGTKIDGIVQEAWEDVAHLRETLVDRRDREVLRTDLAVGNLV